MWLPAPTHPRLSLWLALVGSTTCGELIPPLLSFCPFILSPSLTFYRCPTIPYHFFYEFYLFKIWGESGRLKMDDGCTRSLTKVPCLIPGALSFWWFREATPLRPLDSWMGLFVDYKVSLGASARDCGGGERSLQYSGKCSFLLSFVWPCFLPGVSCLSSDSSTKCFSEFVLEMIFWKTAFCEPLFFSSLHLLHSRQGNRFFFYLLTFD